MFGRTPRWLCTLLLLFCPLVWAADPGCSRYSESGLSLGMDNKSVWRSMGKRGQDAGRTIDPSGYRTIESYEKASSLILVHYDGTVGKKSSARVVSIEKTFEESVVDIPELMARMRDARDRYLQWGRNETGWAVYLFLKDPFPTVV